MQTKAIALLALVVAVIGHASAAHLPNAIQATLSKSVTDAAKDRAIKSSGWAELFLYNGMYQGTLYLRKIENVTMAHIHQGKAGTNGGVVVWIYPYTADALKLLPAIGGDIRISMSFNASLLDPQVVADMGYYFNIHTGKYPGGEIRGQLRLPPPMGSDAKGRKAL